MLLVLVISGTTAQPLKLQTIVFLCVAVIFAVSCNCYLDLPGIIQHYVQCYCKEGIPFGFCHLKFIQQASYSVLVNTPEYTLSQI